MALTSHVFPNVDPSKRMIVSSDADEVSAFFANDFANCIVRPLGLSDRLHYEGNLIVGDDFIAGAGRTDDGLVISPLAEVDLVVVHISQSGSIAIDNHSGSATGNERMIVVAATRSAKQIVHGANRRETFIAVGADSVRRQMSGFVGFEVEARFDFNLALDADSRLGSALTSFGSLLYAGLAGKSLLRSSPIDLRRHKDGFIGLMLTTIGTDALRSLVGPPKSASLRQVRRAEDFMRASCHEPIGIGEVAAHVGVSVRALQYSFRQHRETTPLGVLQRMRIEGFRDDLRRGAPERVADVAARWGFTHLGRLARQYRETFGERPLDTARRARDRR